MMKRLYFFTKICFFIAVVSVSIYLKEKNYLTYIVPSVAFDTTDYIIQFNEFSNVLIVGSLLVLIIFFIYYRISIHLSYVTLLDKTILFYFFIYFITVLVTRHSFYEYTGDLCQLTFILSSITFLQYNSLGILSLGIVLYVPIIYLFFMQKNNHLIWMRYQSCNN